MFKRKNYGFLFVIILTILLSVLFADGPVLKSVVRSENEFAFKVLKEIFNRQTDNFNFSPLSLELALAISCNGAEGETRRELIKVLEFPDEDLNSVNGSYNRLLSKLQEPMIDIKLDLAQSFWIDHHLTLDEEFRNMNSEYYQADLRYLDLQDPLAPDMINSWVYKKTDQKIFSVVDDISSDVILYLLSTIYFKGKWGVPFKEEYSEPNMFKTRDGRENELVFMKTKSKKITWLEGKGFKAVGLPYGEGDLSMYLFLPEETSHIDLFIKLLNKENWKKWMKDFTSQEVVTVIPRVKLDSDITFNEILGDLGIKKAFTEEADFSGMVDGKAFITEVKQKSFIEFNEKGTESAAADKVVFKKGGCEHIYFYRPFFYSLVDNRTGAILMMGIYQN